MAGRKAKTASQANANWKSAMSNPNTAQKYTQGVNAVTESPTAKAAAPDAQQRYRDNTQAASTSGRMAARLSSVTLQQWQQRAASAGAQGLAQAAAKGGAKQLAAAQRMEGAWQQAADGAAAISKDDPLGRVRAAINAMKQAAGKPTI